MILQYKIIFTEYRYSVEELKNFLITGGFEILSCYPEMLVPPKHIGAYIDFIHLTGKIPKNKFEVPTPLSILVNLMKSIYPWLISGMVLLVTKKNE